MSFHDTVSQRATSKPSTPPPIKLGDVMGNAAKLLLKAFPSFFVVSFVSTLPGLLLLAVGTVLNGSVALRNLSWSPSPLEEAAGTVSFGVGVLLLILGYPIAIGLLSHVTEVHLQGGKPGLAAILDGRWMHVFRIAGWWMLALAVTMASFLPLALIEFISESTTPDNNIVWLLFLLAAGVFALAVLWLFLATLLAVPAAVLDNFGPWQAIRCSLSMTRGHRLALFLSMLPVWVSLVTFSCGGSILSGGFEDNITAQLGQDSNGVPLHSISTFAIDTIVNALVHTFHKMALSALAATLYIQLRSARDEVDGLFS